MPELFKLKVGLCMAPASTQTSKILLFTILNSN